MAVKKHNRAEEKPELVCQLSERMRQMAEQVGVEIKNAPPSKRR